MTTRAVTEELVVGTLSGTNADGKKFTYFGDLRNGQMHGKGVQQVMTHNFRRFPDSSQVGLEVPAQQELLIGLQLLNQSRLSDEIQLPQAGLKQFSNLHQAALGLPLFIVTSSLAAGLCFFK